MKTQFIGLKDGITQIVPVNNKTFEALTKGLHQGTIHFTKLHHSIFIASSLKQDAERILDVNGLV